MNLDIKSTAFGEGGLIPKKYTCDGADVSPQLSWSQPPEGTGSMVLICDDPVAPMGTWVHWVLYGLPPDTLEISVGIPDDKEVLGGENMESTIFASMATAVLARREVHTVISSSYMQWIQRLTWIPGRQRMKFLVQLKDISWQKDNLWTDTVDRCDMSIPWYDVC